MENMETKTNDFQLDMGQLFRYFMKKVWIILLTAVIFAAAAYSYTKLAITPVYTSTTKVYVLNKESTNGLSINDMTAAQQLTSDFEDLVKSRRVLDSVIESLNLNDTYESLVPKVSVSVKEETRMLSISVTDTNPKRAQKIANKVRDVMSENVVSIMNIDSVNLVDSANLPKQPSSPSVKKNTLIGFLGGALLSGLVFFLIYAFNDTIKTDEDIERHLGLTVLGAIPKCEKRSSKRSKQS